MLLKSGVTCGAVDAAARNVLQRKGLGRILFIARATGLAWKSMRIPGSPGTRRGFWRRVTS